MSAVFEPRQSPRCFHELETLFGNGFTLSVSLSCFISFSHLTIILLFQKASFQSFGNTKGKHTHTIQKQQQQQQN